LSTCGDFPLRVAIYLEDTTGVSSQGLSPVWDYEHMVNSATNIRTSGSYDLEDLSIVTRTAFRSRETDISVEPAIKQAANRMALSLVALLRLVLAA
jgi:hypothetical protein